MNHQEYIAKLMILGFETGRGNPNAFQEAFPETTGEQVEPPHQTDTPD